MDKRRTFLVGGGTSSATIGGTIAATQVAYGSGADAIKGEAAFIYTEATDTLTVGAVATAGSTPYVEWPNYTSPAVSSASSGRIAYESATQQLRLSKNGAAYADMLSGTFTANTMAYSTGAGVLAPMSGLTWDDTNKDLTWAQGTITTSNPYISHSATWNAGGVTFTGKVSNTTLTAAANGSMYESWQVGGNRRLAFGNRLTASAAGMDFQVVAYNSGNTTQLSLVDEFHAGGVVTKWLGDGASALQWAIQADPGAAAAADTHAFRIGLLRDSFGSLGGANTGMEIIWRNQSVSNEPGICLANSASCIATTNASHLIFNPAASQPTRVQIREGATQGTNPLLEFRNNANSATLFAIGDDGELQPQNCTSSGGTCADAVAGAVTIAAAATTVTVSTTAVTANSNIQISENSAMGTRLGVTCNTTIARTYAVTTITAGTSFVITSSAAPVTNPACLSFLVVN